MSLKHISEGVSIYTSDQNDIPALVVEALFLVTRVPRKYLILNSDSNRLESMHSLGSNSFALKPETSELSSDFGMHSSLDHVAALPRNTLVRPIYMSPTALANRFLGAYQSPNSCEESLFFFIETHRSFQIVLRVVGSRPDRVLRLCLRESLVMGSQSIHTQHSFVEHMGTFYPGSEPYIYGSSFSPVPVTHDVSDPDCRNRSSSFRRDSTSSLDDSRSAPRLRIQISDQYKRILFSTEWAIETGHLNRDAIAWLSECHTHELSNLIPKSHLHVYNLVSSFNEDVEYNSRELNLHDTNSWKRQSSSPTNPTPVADSRESSEPIPSPSRRTSHSVDSSLNLEEFESLSIKSCPSSLSDSDNGREEVLVDCGNFDSKESYDSELSPLSAIESSQGGNTESIDVFQQLGFWLYASLLGQFVSKAQDLDSSPFKSATKTYFSNSPLWLLGNEYRNDQSCGSRLFTLGPIKSLIPHPSHLQKLSISPRSQYDHPAKCINGSQPYVLRETLLLPYINSQAFISHILHFLSNLCSWDVLAGDYGDMIPPKSINSSFSSPDSADSLEHISNDSCLNYSQGSGRAFINRLAEHNTTGFSSKATWIRVIARSRDGFSTIVLAANHSIIEFNDRWLCSLTVRTDFFEESSFLKGSNPINFNSSMNGNNGSLGLKRTLPSKKSNDFEAREFLTGNHKEYCSMKSFFKDRSKSEWNFNPFRQSSLLARTVFVDLISELKILSNRSVGPREFTSHSKSPNSISSAFQVIFKETVNSEIDYGPYPPPISQLSGPPIAPQLWSSVSKESVSYFFAICVESFPKLKSNPSNINSVGNDRNSEEHVFSTESKFPVRVLMWSEHVGDWIARQIEIISDSDSVENFNPIMIVSAPGTDSLGSLRIDIGTSIIYFFTDGSFRFAISVSSSAWLGLRATCATDFTMLVTLIPNLLRRFAHINCVFSSSANRHSFSPLEDSELRIQNSHPSSIERLEPASIRILGMSEFFKHFKRRFWFTYRRGFSRISGSILTSDAGFGCMIRAGQSMLAEALAIVSFGCDRTWDLFDRLNDPESHAKYRKIVSLFLDSSDDVQSPFSIHSIVRVGAEIGTPIGKCFFPSTLCHALRRQCELARARYSSWNDRNLARDFIEGPVPDIPLKIVVWKQGILRFQSIRDSFSSAGTSTPLVLLIPLRLGAEHINTEAYSVIIRASLTTSQSLGILGGRSNRAFYIVGFQDSNLLYLDPHIVRPAATWENIDEMISRYEFHSSIICEMPLSDLDPTVVLAFLLCSASEVEALESLLSEIPFSVSIFSFA